MGVWDGLDESEISRPEILFQSAPGYNNEHDVIVYTVVKDTQSKCGQPRHRFQKCQFLTSKTSE